MEENEQKPEAKRKLSSEENLDEDQKKKRQKQLINQQRYNDEQEKLRLTQKHQAKKQRVSEYKREGINVRKGDDITSQLPLTVYGRDTLKYLAAKNDLPLLHATWKEVQKAIGHLTEINNIIYSHAVATQVSLIKDTYVATNNAANRVGLYNLSAFRNALQILMQHKGFGFSKAYPPTLIALPQEMDQYHQGQQFIPNQPSSTRSSTASYTQDTHARFLAANRGGGFGNMGTDSHTIPDIVQQTLPILNTDLSPAILQRTATRTTLEQQFITANDPNLSLYHHSYQGYQEGRHSGHQYRSNMAHRPVDINKIPLLYNYLQSHNLLSDIGSSQSHFSHQSINQSSRPTWHAGTVKEEHKDENTKDQELLKQVGTYVENIGQQPIFPIHHTPEPTIDTSSNDPEAIREEQPETKVDAMQKVDNWLDNYTPSFAVANSISSSFTNLSQSEENERGSNIEINQMNLTNETNRDASNSYRYRMILPKHNNHNHDR